MKMSPLVSYCFLYRNIIGAGVHSYRPCSTVKIGSKGAMGSLPLACQNMPLLKGLLYRDCLHMLFDLLTTGLEINQSPS